MGDNELDLRISMKAILMYEKLSGKQFSIMQDEESVTLFMYCVFVCSTEMKITFPVFCTMLEKKKFATNIGRQFKRIFGYVQQFKTDQKEGEQEDGNDSVSGVSMTDYINTLVFDYGIGIDYVMNKMELWELEALYNAAEAHMHTQMEDKRLWAYLQMLPNFDKKHRNLTPEKFLPFPWEKEDHKNKVEKELERETKISKGIIGMNINNLLGKNEEQWQQENSQ